MGRWSAIAAALGLVAAGPLAASPVSAGSALPRIEKGAVHPRLIVDGHPFLMLGAQANNSSNYASALPLVWPTIERLHANTLEILNNIISQVHSQRAFFRQD